MRNFQLCSDGVTEDSEDDKPGDCALLVEGPVPGAVAGSHDVVAEVAAQLVAPQLGQDLSPSRRLL